MATAAGFEPTNEFRSGFQVHRLNHSAKQPQKATLKNRENKSIGT